MEGKRIRIVVIDDAEYMRKAITKILQTDPHMEVVGYGRTGVDGIREIKRLKPDVVTLDIDMPEMDGIRALRHIMIQVPTPVVIVSALTHQGDITFEALRLGAVDFLPKPSGSISRDIEVQKEDLINRVKIASTADINKIRRARIPNTKDAKRLPVPAWTRHKIILVGTSLGGPNSIIRLICKLPKNLPVPVVVTQDISPVIIDSFVEKFDSVAPLAVKSARDGVELEAATVYINSLDRYLMFDRNVDNNISITLMPSEGKPIDAMLLSGSETFGTGTIGMLFAGVKRDGVSGLSAVNDHGGVTIMEDRSGYFLPDSNQEIARQGIAQHVLDDRAMPPFVTNLLKEA
jgi:two-component system, chemotaxis family, protein-glutamate methylesterase/glutaminase